MSRAQAATFLTKPLAHLARWPQRWPRIFPKRLIRQEKLDPPLQDPSEAYAVACPTFGLYLFAAANLEHEMGLYHVTAEWDDAAQVWVASSDDVPGLATGAETLEGLIEKLKIVIPELLVENGLLPASVESVPFAVRAERTELARVG
jgi:predicted RNase H-like HicB family nuclease